MAIPFERYDRKITVKTPGAFAPTPDGGQAVKEIDVATFWASKSVDYANEIAKYRTLVTRIDAIYRTRYRADLSEKMILWDGNDRYIIEAVYPNRGRKEQLVIIASLDQRGDECVSS
jgi:SPP1 family predicted phage head-tail adaptor